MVVVLVDRAVEGVFNGDDRGVAAEGAKRGEDFLKSLTGNDFDLRPEQFYDGLVAESSSLALEGYA
jgi:hypothetical protein